MRVKSKIISAILVMCMIMQGHQLLAQLSGVYTIDPSKPASSGNYQNFTSAVGDLIDTIRQDLGKVNGPGVNGRVVFNVANGIYQEKLLILDIKGSSAKNTITFQAESGDSSKVILVDSAVYPPSQSYDDYLIDLSGAQYFIFKNLSFVRPNGGYVILLSNHAGNMLFENNVISENDNKSADVTDDDEYGKNNGFVNNYFKNGGGGIYLGNSTGGYDSNYVFRGNIFLNVNNAMYSNKSIRLQITGNKIIGKVDSSACAINLQTPLGPALVKDNIIELHGDTNLAGIYVQSANFYIASSGFIHDSSRILITDNMISLYDPVKKKNVRGIDFEEGYFSDIIYNTVFIDSTPSPYSIPLYFDLNSSNDRILDNNLVNKYGNYALYLIGPDFDPSDTLDYNNYYAKNGLAYWNPDLQGSTLLPQALPTIFSLDSFDNCDHHSISVLSSFVSDSDLHTTSSVLHGKGIPFPSVTDDIDGNPRNKVHPDIGATELNIKHDLGLGNVQYPQKVVCTNTASVKASLSLTNYGANVERNVEIYYKVAGTIDSGSVFIDTAVRYNGTDTFRIILPLNIKDSGQYKVLVFINLDSDQNHINDTVTYNIHIISAPKPSFAVSNACVNEPVLFTNNTKGDSTGLSYIWYFGDGDTSYTKTASHAYILNTTYIATLKIIDSIGCSDSTSSKVTLLPLSYTGFSFNANKNTIQFAPDTTTFAYYKWDFGDGDTSISLNPSHTYKQDNIYIVTLDVKRSNGCIDSVQELLDIIDAGAGVPQAVTNGLSIYPNPFYGLTVLHLQLDHELPVEIALYNSYGIVVKQIANDVFAQCDCSYPINAKELGLSPGIYYLKFRSGTYENTIKLVYLK